MSKKEVSELYYSQNISLIFTGAHPWTNRSNLQIIANLRHMLVITAICPRFPGRVFITAASVSCWLGYTSLHLPGFCRLVSTQLGYEHGRRCLTCSSTCTEVTTPEVEGGVPSARASTGTQSGMLAEKPATVKTLNAEREEAGHL